MTNTLKDGLFTFGSNQIAEVPPKLSVGGDISNTNDATPKAPLGVLLRHKGNVYRYVQFDNGTGDVAAIAGGVLHWKTLDPANGQFIATSVYASRIAKNLLAGLSLNVVTDQYYTWIQVGGVHLLARVHSSTVAGDVMVYGATNNQFGRVAADSALTGTPYGVALAEDAGNYGPVLLMNMIW